MKIAIPFYWGIENPTGKAKARVEKANISLRIQAEKMVARIPKCKKNYHKSAAFQKYFIAFKRLQKGTTYGEFLNTEKVDSYIWSFALYLTKFLDYPRDLLEIDWEEARDIAEKLY